MAHREQQRFCRWVRRRHPHFFFLSTIIDVGSLDINGSNRGFFWWPKCYLGIDIAQGKNVDINGRAHELLPDIAPHINRRIYPRSPFMVKAKQKIDVIISTEMLEHDEYYKESL